MVSVSSRRSMSLKDLNFSQCHVNWRCRDSAMSYFGEGLHMPRERTKQQKHMQWAVNYIYMSISFCCGCQKKIRHQHCKNLEGTSLFYVSTFGPVKSKPHIFTWSSSTDWNYTDQLANEKKNLFLKMLTTWLNKARSKIQLKAAM